VDDERTPWLDAADGEEAPGWSGRRRFQVLVAAASLPWLVVAVVVLSPGGDEPPPQPVADGDAVQGTADEPPSAGDAPPGQGTDDPVLEITELRGDWRLGPEVGDLGAVAMLVARAWLGGAGPVLSVDGLEPLTGTYLEQVAVETVERPGPGVAVVSLSAVVLEAQGEGFVARARRLAVPLAVGDVRVRPAGQPWWLPGHDLTPTTLETTPVDEEPEMLAAAQAVSDAGYQEVELVALERSGTGPWIAWVESITPEGLEVSGPVWLRRHLDGFVVVGTPPQPRPAAPQEVGP